MKEAQAERGVLYHGSRFHFGEGFLLEPQKDGYVQSEDVMHFERMVEDRRPIDRLSRFQSVFLSADPDLIDSAGGYIDAVYRVEVLSKPEASDLAWYTAAWCENDSSPCNAAARNALIDRYWSGEPFQTPEQSNIEYRVTAAIVVEMVELNVALEDLEVIKRPIPSPGPRMG